MRTKIFAPLIFSFLVACSHTPSPNSIDSDNDNNNNSDKRGKISSPEKSPQTVEEQLSFVNTRLEELEKSAKENGPEAIKYLAGDFFLKGDRASLEGDTISASILFSHILNLAPNNSFIQRKLSLELIKQGKIEEARNLLENVLSKSKGEDEKATILLSGVYYTLLEKERSLALLKKAIQKWPLKTEFVSLLVQYYYKENSVNLALDVLRDAEKRFEKASPKFITGQKKKEILGQLYYQEGKIDHEQKKAKEAITCWEKALSYAPDHLYATLSLAKVYEDQGQYLVAHKIYKNFLSYSPSNPLVLGKIVQMIFFLERYQEATPYLKILSYIDPDDLNILLKLAILYLDNEEYEKALPILLDLHKKSDSSDKVSYYLGTTYRELKNIEESIAFFNKVSSDSELYEDSLAQLAQNYAQLSTENPDKYESLLFTFIDENSKKFPNLRLVLSITKSSYLETKNRVHEATLIMEELQQANLKGFNEEHEYFLASLYEKSGDFEKSYDLIKKILDKNPKNAHAWNFWGYSLLERGIKLKESLQYIQKAATLLPEDGFIRDSLGWYYYKTGNLEKALKEILVAYKKTDEDGTVSKHLGVVYHALKRYDEAETYYRRALALSSNSREQNEIKELINAATQKRPATFSTTASLFDKQ